jgi:hypothetical protein
VHPLVNKSNFDNIKIHGTNVKIIAALLFTVELSVACSNKIGVAIISVTAMGSFVAGGH